MRMSDTIIVKSKIKELVGEMSVGGDLADALDAKARQLLTEAVKRAKDNGRRTVMGKDV